MNDFVNVPHERTEAMRLVPDRVLTETLYWMARAYERVHSMPRVSDTELANKIEAAKADLGRARDASPILSNSAAPAPEGGAVSGPGGYLVKDFADGWYWTPNAALDHASGAPVWSVADGRYETDPPALATREEAPAEAGVQETLRVLLDNLVIAQSLSKELRQRATDEARSYLSALRAQPPAREDAQPVGWKHTDKCWGKTSYSDEMAHCYCQKEQEKEASPQPVGWLRPDTLKGLMDADESVVGIQSLVAAHETKHNTVAVYTHPAPDALRVALPDPRCIDAVQRMLDRFDRAKGKGGYPTANERWAMRECVEALAALQAEQKGGA